MDEHSFCRCRLAGVMADVRKHVPAADIKAAWAWSDGRDHYEFHGPADSYFFSMRMVDCLWSARASGWSEYLGQLGIPEYKATED